jgi:hypothetical protein
VRSWFGNTGLPPRKAWQMGGGYADLVVEPSPITFHLKPGGRAEQQITIHNRTKNTVHFSNYETSCDCVRLKWPEGGVSIEPNQSVSLMVFVDMSDDPQYVGSFGPVILLTMDRKGLSIQMAVEVNKYNR